MTYQLFLSDSFHTSVWSGGTTTELYLLPHDGSYADRRFTFRISSATVESDVSVFTPLPGVRRIIAPLDGTLVLRHGGDGKEIVLQPFECYAFDGGMPTESRGCVRDFNIMYRPECLVRADVLSHGEAAEATLGAEERLFFFSFGGHRLRLDNAAVAMPPMSLALVTETDARTIGYRVEDGQKLIAIHLALAGD